MSLSGDSKTPCCVAVKESFPVPSLVVEGHEMTCPASTEELCLCREKKIIFFADDHFGTHAGRNIFEHLPSDLRDQISFYENDAGIMDREEWEPSCSLLVLHAIAGASLPVPGEGVIRSVRKFLERGGNLLLLHGSSAAFPPFPWWKGVPGLRWVRSGDPDGSVPSFHPHEPYVLTKAKCSHPLIPLLLEAELPEDEVYTGLEQTSPVTILLETRISTGTWPQAWESVTPFGGKVLSFLPGHRAEVTSHPSVIADIAVMMRYLLS